MRNRITKEKFGESFSGTLPASEKTTTSWPVQQTFYWIIIIIIIRYSIVENVARHTCTYSSFDYWNISVHTKKTVFYHNWYVLTSLNDVPYRIPFFLQTARTTFFLWFPTVSPHSNRIIGSNNVFCEFFKCIPFVCRPFENDRYSACNKLQYS